MQYKTYNMQGTLYKIKIGVFLSFLTVLTMKGIQGADLVVNMSPNQTEAKHVDNKVLEYDKQHVPMKYVYPHASKRPLSSGSKKLSTGLLSRLLKNNGGKPDYVPRRRSHSNKNGFQHRFELDLSRPGNGRWLNSLRLNSQEKARRSMGQALEDTAFSHSPDRSNDQMLKSVEVNKYRRYKRQAFVDKDAVSYNGNGNRNILSNNNKSVNENMSRSIAPKYDNLDNSQDRINQEETMWERKQATNNDMRKTIQTNTKLRNSSIPKFKKTQLSDMYKSQRGRKLWLTQKAMADALVMNKQNFLNPFLLYTTTVAPAPNNGYTNRIIPYRAFPRRGEGTGSNNEPHDDVDETNLVPHTIEDQNYKEIQSQVDTFRKKISQHDKQVPFWSHDEGNIRRYGGDGEDVEKTNLIPERDPYDSIPMKNLREFNQFKEIPQFNQFKEIPQFNQFKEIPQFNQFKEIPQFNQFKEIPQFNQFKEIPQFNQFKEIPQFNQFKEIPQFNQFKEIPQFNQFKEIPQFNQFKEIPQFNFKLPTIPENFNYKMPSLPKNFNFRMPTIPELKPPVIPRSGSYFPRFSFRG